VTFFLGLTFEKRQFSRDLGLLQSFFSKPELEFIKEKDYQKMSANYNYDFFLQNKIGKVLGKFWDFFFNAEMMQKILFIIIRLNDYNKEKKIPK
jgi:hypothetical protein